MSTSAPTSGSGPTPRGRARWLWVAIAAALTVLANLLWFAADRPGGGPLLVQQSINALTLGGIYALIAVGYTLIYGIVKLINFAHGEIYMLGAMFGTLLVVSGTPFWIALPLAMLGCGIVSITMDQVAYRPLRQMFRTRVLVPLMVALAGSLAAIAHLFMSHVLPWPVALLIAMALCGAYVVASEKWAYLATVRQSPRLAALITAIGMSLVLQNGAMMLFGAEIRPFPNLKPEVALHFAAPAGETPWNADVRDRVRSSLDGALTASRDGRIDDVPFHFGLRAQLRAVAIAKADRDPSVGDIEMRARMTREGLPALKTFTFSERAGGLSLALVFGLGAAESEITRYCADLRNWLASPQDDYLEPGLGIPAAMDSSTERHLFEIDLVEWAAGPGAGFALPLKVVFIWLAAAAILLAMNAIVHRTRLGMAMRACALDRDAASLMGVNVNRVIAVTFLLSGAMAAVGGMLFGLYIGGGIYYRMGYYAGVMAFFAAVLGGIGNLKGAVVGGMILGVVQGISTAYVTDWLTAWVRSAGTLVGADLSGYTVNSSYAYAIACVILITVILIRPTGLLGSKGADRA